MEANHREYADEGVHHAGLNDQIVHVFVKLRIHVLPVLQTHRDPIRFALIISGVEWCVT